jgi:hypothetical protein
LAAPTRSSNKAIGSSAPHESGSGTQRRLCGKMPAIDVEADGRGTRPALPLTRRGGLSSRVSLLLPTAKFGIINIWAMAAIQR